jgi:excisionase family DNA binding protein
MKNSPNTGGHVQSAPAEREWLTLKEMQEMLAIGRTKAWEIVASGQVRAVKIGRSVRVHRPSLEEWLAQQSYSVHDRVYTQGEEGGMT